MKILLAVDGSVHTKRMLSYIAAHDELLGARHAYTAYCVVAPIPSHAAAFLSREVVDSYYQGEVDRVLQPVGAFGAQQGWTLELKHSVGHAGEAISELAAAAHYDLVVMGTHGHSGLAGAVLGSVTQRVIAQSKVPVLLVP